MQQALASLDSVEALRPGSTNNLRQRIGVDERVPEFVEDTMRTGQIPDGLLDILTLMPKSTLHYVTTRFANCGFREDCELLGSIVSGLGEDAVQRLADTLQNAPANEATEVIGLLTQLSPSTVEQVLPTRLAQWPRTSHDRTVRQLSSAPVEQRAQLLLALYDTLDPLIRPLALDEMGMSGRPECINKIVELVQDDSTPGFTRIKAIEAAGRLRASAASPLLQKILDAKQVWRWAYPTELRIAAAQALQKIEPALAMEKIAASGLDRKELVLEPTGSGAECAGDSATKVRTTEIDQACAVGDHEFAGKHADHDCGTEHERRHRSGGPAFGAGVVADDQDVAWRAEYPRASDRAGRAAAGDGV